MNANDAAFPYDVANNSGLTKREHIATQILAGILAADAGLSVRQEPGMDYHVANLAVWYADALIAELSKAGAR